ncbi:glycosyltransferase family 1 protein [Lentiprolixibacter aurantiacus]|uniref:Glycosyltransferase family 1 protein n=1 Tax=Lentiprolixibacter aurantiacus TaxID=2993939 RepID=A0AAE3SNK2_9FLAO|nr:glycosyltransferase family 1 protein [Lentiprolixibacter aurantiacus]MCX2719862.1 glycosyltransferase family 1 protein [Lentiprolixibacter aurantiacus]
MNANKPIRVLQVLTIMNRGGAESMIMNYYRNIDRTKVQFDFLLHRKDKGAFDDEIKALGGRIYRLDPINPVRFFKYKKELRHFFKKHQSYSIVHSHLNALSSFVLEEARRHGVNIRIAHSHTAVDPKSLNKLLKRHTDRKAIIKKYLQHMIRQRVARSATHFLTCSSKAGNWLFPGVPKERIQILNNAIDSSNFQYNQETRSKIRKVLGLEGKKIIGHVGIFKEEKNHIFLIDIFKNICQKNNDYHLLLVGDGPLKEKVKTKVEAEKLTKSVSFLGLRADIADLLQGMDLFVFPSIYEGLPVSLIEAQGAGLTIFCSDRVTQEVDITGLIEFIPLKKDPAFWADKILSAPKYSRKNTLIELQKGKYDIKENARLLSDFYLKKYHDLFAK